MKSQWQGYCILVFLLSTSILYIWKKKKKLKLQKNWYSNSTLSFIDNPCLIMTDCILFLYGTSLLITFKAFLFFMYHFIQQPIYIYIYIYTYHAIVIIFAWNVTNSWVIYLLIEFLSMQIHKFYWTMCKR